MLVRRKKFVVIFASLIAICLAGSIGHPSAFSFLSRLSKRIYYEAATSNEQFRYNGTAKLTPIGKSIVGLSMRSLWTEAQVFLFVGRIGVTGKITPQSAGALIPTKLQVITRHKAVSGKVLMSNTFTVNVQSTGAILLQSFPFANFDLINPHETLELTVVPLDRPMPVAKINLVVTHTLGSSFKPDLEADAMDTATVPPAFAFSVTGHYLNARPKAKPYGPFQLRELAQAGFDINGSLRFKGKISPFPGGVVGFPNTLRFTFRHKNLATGALLRSEDFDVKVDIHGIIPLQSFPITTQNPQGVKEFLEITFRYLDRSVADRLANLTMFYFPTPPPPPTP
jgi:hypothetical protein